MNADKTQLAGSNIEAQAIDYIEIANNAHLTRTKALQQTPLHEALALMEFLIRILLMKLTLNFWHVVTTCDTVVRGTIFVNKWRYSFFPSILKKWTYLLWFFFLVLEWDNKIKTKTFIQMYTKLIIFTYFVGHKY